MAKKIIVHLPVTTIRPDGRQYRQNSFEIMFNGNEPKRDTDSKIYSHSCYVAVEVPPKTCISADPLILTPEGWKAAMKQLEEIFWDLEDEREAEEWDE